MKCQKCHENSVELTVKCLKEGGVAILPTDTVYGFSGIVDLENETNFSTDDKIRSIKGRSESKPLIQLIANPCDIKNYTDDEIPQSLLDKWPGPLTVIVKIKKDCRLKDKLETVAFRCPGDEWLRKVIEETGAPVYSTSVNRSGFPVLDEEMAIEKEFGPETDLFVADGDKKGSVPSTIVAVENGNIKILRQGAVIL